jgi:hypothetical protein
MSSERGNCVVSANTHHGAAVKAATTPRDRIRRSRACAGYRPPRTSLVTVPGCPSRDRFSAPADRESLYAAGPPSVGRSTGCPTTSADVPRGRARIHDFGGAQSVRAVSRRNAHFLEHAACRRPGVSPIHL